MTVWQKGLRPYQVVRVIKTANRHDGVSDMSRIDYNALLAATREELYPQGSKS